MIDALMIAAAFVVVVIVFVLIGLALLRLLDRMCPPDDVNEDAP